jgi:hypothetical protein
MAILDTHTAIRKNFLVMILYQAGISRLRRVMTNIRKAVSASFLAVGTANIDAVTDDAPLTSADVVRELKKEATDVFGTRGKFSEAMGEPDNTVGRYFRGERDMPADFLLRAIPLLGVTAEQFFANARATRSVPTKGD